MKINEKSFFNEAKKEFENYRKNPLFWSGLMLYAGKGDKTNKNQIRFSSSEFFMVRIFISFLISYLGVTRETVKCSLFLNKDDNHSLAKEMWVNALLLNRDQFYHYQIRREKYGVGRSKKLHYGIGTIILSNVLLKKKLLLWISFSQDERFL